MLTASEKDIQYSRTEDKDSERKGGVEKRREEKRERERQYLNHLENACGGGFTG